MSEHTYITDAPGYITLRVPQGLKDELLHLAESEDRSLSYYIRKVLTDHAATAVQA